MKDLAKSQYAPVNFCIYCGNTEGLTREHIVPFGLSGTAVLPKASCPTCTEITKKFEEEVLRGPMWAVRIWRQLKSRRKHQKAPDKYPITIIKNGHEEIINLSIDEYPILLHFPIFPPPGLFAPQGYISGININGVATVSFGPKPAEVAKKLGAQSLKITQNYKPVPFARMLAKISYCIAFAEGALDQIKGQSTVLPAILGQKDDIGMWVGTITEPIIKHNGLLHRVLTHRDEEKGLLIGEVHFFSDSQTPSYGVILGRLKK